MSVMHEPLHPGEIVKDALFNDTGIKTVGEAALKLDIDRTTLSRLINGHSGISPEMAYKLANLLKTSVEKWTKIQHDYDLWKVKIKKINFLEEDHDKQASITRVLLNDATGGTLFFDPEDEKLQELAHPEENFKDVSYGCFDGKMVDKQKLIDHINVLREKYAKRIIHEPKKKEFLEGMVAACKIIALNTDNGIYDVFTSLPREKYKKIARNVKNGKTPRILSSTNYIIDTRGGRGRIMRPKDKKMITKKLKSYYERSSKFIDDKDFLQKFKNVCQIIERQELIGSAMNALNVMLYRLAKKIIDKKSISKEKLKSHALEYSQLAFDLVNDLAVLKEQRAPKWKY